MLTGGEGEEHWVGQEPGQIWDYFFRPLLLCDSALTSLQHWMFYQQLLFWSVLGGELVTECAVLLLPALGLGGQRILCCVSWHREFNFSGP